MDCQTTAKCQSDACQRHARRTSHDARRPWRLKLLLLGFTAFARALCLLLYNDIRQSALQQQNRASGRHAASGLLGAEEETQQRGHP
eukprot:878924-Rhodomonas_salina.1